MKYIFVGERPSIRAHNMGVTWKDGRLAAKTLFEALRASGITPEAHRFDNVFINDPFGPEVPCKLAIRRIKRAASAGYKVVAMGNKVSTVLSERVEFISIIHPAARGKIRKRELYINHIREKLC